MKRYKLPLLLLSLTGLVLTVACGNDRLFDVAKLSEQGEESVPQLIELMGHKDWKMRREAAWALARIGPPARPAVPVLISGLSDSQEGIRYFSALALGEIGSTVAIPELRNALEDENPYVRSVSAVALGKIGGLTDVIVPALIARLADEDDLVRGSAAQALEDLGTPEALAAIEGFDGSVLQHYHAACFDQNSAGKAAEVLHICVQN